MNDKPHSDDSQTPPDFDEYGDVPDSIGTTDTDEREDRDESPLG
ncbi:hypothetical protein ACPESN_06885 [Stutzerimonas marianensis]